MSCPLSGSLSPQSKWPRFELVDCQPHMKNDRDLTTTPGVLEQTYSSLRERERSHSVYLNRSNCCMMMTLYFLIFLLTNNWLQIIFLRLHFLDCAGYRREYMNVLLDQTFNERGLFGHDVHVHELHLPNWSSIFINSRSFLEHLPDFTTAFIMLLIAS